MLFTPAQRRILQWAALGLAVAAVVWLLGPVLTPFAIGAVLAYALHPLVEKLAANRVPRLLAVAIVEIGALIVAASLVLLVVPILSKELPLLRDQLPLLVERINRVISPWLTQMGIDFVLDTASIRAYILKYLDANWDESFAAALMSVRIGGSILLTVVGYVGARAGGAVLPARRLAALHGAADQPRAAAAARQGRRVHRRMRQPCSASTCAASCW